MNQVFLDHFELLVVLQVKRAPFLLSADDAALFEVVVTVCSVPANNGCPRLAQAPPHITLVSKVKFSLPFAVVCDHECLCGLLFFTRQPVKASQAKPKPGKVWQSKARQGEEDMNEHLLESR